MAHGVVRLDKLLAGYNGNLEHIVHSADLDNGSFVHVGSLVAGNTDLRNAVVPATATLTDEVVLIAAPELLYDTVYGGQLDKFYNEAGRATRAYHLYAGDVFSVSESMLTGTVAVGKFVIPANGSVKLAVADTDGGTTRFVGKIIAREVFGVNAIPMAVIEVKKA